jgi:hypothetical protein
MDYPDRYDIRPGAQSKSLSDFGIVGCQAGL